MDCVSVHARWYRWPSFDERSWQKTACAHAGIRDNPAWAADGKEIYFSSDILDNVGRPTLFAIDVDGGDVRKLAEPAHACEEPVESPDRQWIAYVSTQGANKNIHLIRVADGEIQQLTQDPGQEFSPAWVPSGLSVPPNAVMQITLWGTLKQTTVKTGLQSTYH